MSCTPGTCVQPTPAQAHCGSCHVTFGGVRLFDQHRYTLPGGERRACLHPRALGAEERNGVWRVPSTPEKIAALRGLRSDAEGTSQ